MLFHACPLLHQWSHDHEQAFNTFMHYKTRVPVCGAIMLNDTWEKCLLVKGWKSSSGWGFPKGKINEDEPPPTCAVREVLEETGYNLAGKINPNDVIEMSIREQKMSLFIVPGIPEDFPFKTKTRKEISKIEWFKLTDLPTWRRNKASPGKFYLISPFIGALKAFINEHKPRGVRKKCKTPSPYHSPNESAQESSSQSSSVENGEPQTPSPQYSAPTVNSGSHFLDSRLELSTESMDPHFARLLSSLTLSAAASAKEAEPDNVRAAPASVPIIEPKSPARHRRSARLHSRKPSLDVQPMLPLRETTDCRHDVAPDTPSHASAQDPKSAAQSPHTAPKRMSSTADISPYLSRLVEPPTSAKQMKQLALLESVADESAKLSCALSHQSPMSFEAAKSSPVTSFPSLQPLSTPYHSPTRRVSRNSGSISFPQGSPLLMTLGGTSSMTPYSPLPARSRTSHALYRGQALVPHPNVSMAQPFSLDAFRRTPELFVVPPLQGQIHTAAHITPKATYIRPQAQFGLASRPSMPAVDGSVLPLPNSAHNPAPISNSLLSILNSKPGHGLSPTSPGSYFHGRP
jgi:mRNA-decapping enzyme subunit 2